MSSLKSSVIREKFRRALTAYIILFLTMNTTSISITQSRIYVKSVKHMITLKKKKNGTTIEDMIKAQLPKL